jgi:hypothetical protein
MRRSANGAQYDYFPEGHALGACFWLIVENDGGTLRASDPTRRSANGAQYGSQGQARSASPLDHTSKKASSPERAK